MAGEGAVAQCMVFSLFHSIRMLMVLKITLESYK